MVVVSGSLQLLLGNQWCELLGVIFLEKERERERERERESEREREIQKIIVKMMKRQECS